MILQALTTYFTLQNVCLALGGNIIGLIFGAIPGLTGSMALALFLPVSFIMPGYTGLIFLGSMYIGGNLRRTVRFDPDGNSGYYRLHCHGL